MEIKLELEVPEGYSFVRYGQPKEGEMFLRHGEIYTAYNQLSSWNFIFEPIHKEEMK